jgi:hypothetical protein
MPLSQFASNMLELYAIITHTLFKKAFSKDIPGWRADYGRGAVDTTMDVAFPKGVAVDDP